MKLADVDDIPALVEMGRRFHEQTQDIPFCTFSMAEFFKSLMQSGIVFIHGQGFICGAIGPFPSNRDHLTAHEVLWWSEDGQGAELRKAFEVWATGIGCQEIEFSHPANTPAAGRMLRRAGYSRKTEAWTKCVSQQV